MFGGKEDLSISEAVQGELTKESLQTGGEIVQTSSKPLSQGGRSSIVFRVVGDKSHGWAEAAALWGGTVELITHRSQDNSRIRAYFDLPCSIPVATAYRPPFPDSSWTGILLATILGENDARDVGALFEAWQPLIAILALPFSLSRNERSSYSGFKEGPLKQPGYLWKDIKVAHTEVGGVTESV